jgi:hypothetical protein
LPIVQSGQTRQVAIADLTAGRAVSMLSATAGNVQIASNTISSTNSNGIINLLPNGTGHVQIGQQTAGGARVSDFVGPNVTTLGTIAESMINLYAQSGTGANGTINLTYGVLISGATYGAGALALKWTSTSGYGQGDLLVALRNATTDSAPTEVWRFTSDGSFKQAVASKGINFTANSAAAGMTSQLLNWYEEGTWTPTMVLGGGSVTYTSQSGRYTRIGRVVVFSMLITVNTATTPSSTMEIGGLPFTPTSGALGAVAIQVTGATASATTTWMGNVESSAKFIRVYTYAAGNLANPGSYVQAGFNIQISGTYEV